MSYFVVDIEADGPTPGDYSMISLGAVLVEPSLERTFSGQLRPISEKWLPDALAVSGHTREETLAFEEPKQVMQDFRAWIDSVKQGLPHFVADNNGFDWQFVNWYFHHFLGENPFGFTSVSLGSLYKGLVKDMRQNFKHLRETHHSHDPLDDALGNAEALLAMREKYGLKIEW